MKIGRVLIGVLTFCAGTHIWAQKVHVDWDRSTDFSKLKTYSWLESKHPAEGVWNQRVIDGVDARLTAAEWKKVDVSAHPNVEVVYNAGLKERTTVEGYNYEYGPWWWYELSGKPKLHYVERNATLVIDLVNQSKQQMIWRATAGDTLADTSDENIKKLNRALNKMFAHFPPTQK